jgi:hypothetical protein
MGRVLRGRDTQLHRDVALKVAEGRQTVDGVFAAVG